MVMRLDLEDGGQPVANVDRAGILSRPLQHAWTIGRQFLQMNPRALVTAVFGPHHRKNPEFGQRRLASEGFDDAVVFVWGEPVPLKDRGVDGAHEAAVLMRPCAATCERTDSNKTSPSVLPSTDSHARSGCGISP